MSTATFTKTAPKARPTISRSPVQHREARPQLVSLPTSDSISQALLTTLLDHSQHGIMGLDDELRLRFANKVLGTMFPGWSLLPGQALAMALPATELLALAQRSLKLREPQTSRFSGIKSSPTSSRTRSKRTPSQGCAPPSLESGMRAAARSASATMVWASQPRTCPSSSSAFSAVPSITHRA